MESCSWLWPSYEDGITGAIGIGAERRSPSTPRGESTAVDNKLREEEEESAGSPCGVDELHVPEMYDCCSGTTACDQVQEDGGTDLITSNNASMTTPPPKNLGALRSPSPTNNTKRTWCCSPTSKPKPRANLPPPVKKPMTITEAFNEGTILQYLMELNFCTKDTATENYENKWKGHQPLARDNWTSDGGDDVDETITATTASEKRLMRRRLRRGVLSPSRRVGGGAKVGSSVDASLAQGSIAFPGEVVDPHLLPKKKWEPHC